MDGGYSALLVLSEIVFYFILLLLLFYYYYYSTKFSVLMWWDIKAVPRTLNLSCPSRLMAGPPMLSEINSREAAEFVLITIYGRVGVDIFMFTVA